MHISKEPCWWCRGPDGQCEYPKTSNESKCPICGCTKDSCPVEPAKERCNGES